MIHKAVTRLLRRRHFWRDASFDEIAELHVAQLTRVLVVSMVTLFVVVYLYLAGYSLLYILLYMAAYFVFRALVTIPAAQYVVRLGTSHARVVANLLYSLALIVLVFVPPASSAYALPLLAIFGALQALGGALYDYAYRVAFSRVKHAGYMGRELGYLHTLEKVVATVGPVLGGVLATVTGPVVVALVGAALLFGSTIPLLSSVRPVPRRERLRWRGFPWRTTWRTLVAQGSTGFDGAASSWLWMLFLVATVFALEGRIIYTIVGLLIAAGMLVSMAVAYVCGKLVDRRRGYLLLTYGTIAKSLVHLARPLVATPAGVTYLTVGSEATSTAYGIALARSTYQVADRSGARHAYLLLVQLASSLGSALAAALLALLLLHLDDTYAFMMFFLVAAIVALLVGLPRVTVWSRSRQ